MAEAGDEPASATGALTASSAAPVPTAEAAAR